MCYSAIILYIHIFLLLLFFTPIFYLFTEKKRQVMRQKKKTKQRWWWCCWWWWWRCSIYWNWYKLFTQVYFLWWGQKRLLRPNSLTGSGSSAWKKDVRTWLWKSNKNTEKKEVLFSRNSSTVQAIVPKTNQKRNKNKLTHDKPWTHPWKIRASPKTNFISCFFNVYTRQLYCFETTELQLSCSFLFSFRVAEEHEILGQ